MNVRNFWGLWDNSIVSFNELIRWFYEHGTDDCRDKTYFTSALHYIMPDAISEIFRFWRKLRIGETEKSLRLAKLNIFTLAKDS